MLFYQYHNVRELLCHTSVFHFWETVVSSLPMVVATLRLAWLEQMVDATEYLSCQALRVAWTHSVERNLAGWIWSPKFNQTRCHILIHFESNLLDMKWESCGMWWCGKMDQISMISGLLFA